MNREDIAIKPEEFYAFDLNGYLIVEDAIDPDLLQEVNKIADVWEAKEAQAWEVKMGRRQSSSNTAYRFREIVNENELFLKVAMSPKVIARVVNFIQDPRMKSTWIDFKPKHGNIHFHANHTPHNPVDAYYFQGGIYANLVTVCYALKDIPAGGGALEVIPGSHKANFPLPDEAAQRPLRRELPLKAGSALIFTHDMNHGSYNHLDYVRRTMFTSFSTGSSSNSSGSRDDLYDRIFEASPEGSWQKYLLRRPQGNADSYPQPKHSVADEVVLGLPKALEQAQTALQPA